MYKKVILSAACLMFFQSASAADCSAARKQLLVKTWSKLFTSQPTAKTAEKKETARFELEDFYRKANKPLEANFIANATEKDLAEKIAQIDSGLISDFPQVDCKLVYRVRKLKSGTLTFSPITGCTGHFSITPRSAHFLEACKHVGTISVGEVKAVPDLPFTLSPSEQTVVVSVEDM